MVRIQVIEDYARKNGVPIMEKDGIEFLLSYIKSNNIKNILEIGTAIGYSSIRMALVSPDIKITTIERDINRYNIAVDNVSNFGLDNQINLIYDDAFNVVLDGYYDLIFIDAAKSQNIKFFEFLKSKLNDGGVIVTDNLSFHNLVDGEVDGLSRNVRGIVRKIKKYIDFLNNNNEFETFFYEIGDRIAISKRR